MFCAPSPCSNAKGRTTPNARSRFDSRLVSSADSRLTQHGRADTLCNNPRASSSQTRASHARSNARTLKSTKKMFSLSSTAALARARVSAPRKTARKLTIRASVNYILDRAGCSSARSDDDGVLLQTAAKTCLAVPIDVNALVAQNKGDLEFENEQLKFELDDSSALVVQSLKGKTLIDGKAAPKGRKLKLRVGSKIKIADEEFTVYRNTHAHA